MLKEIIASGKDVAEAKENARALLGAGELDDVQFEIIHAGSRGIFGIIGVKPAQVRAFIEMPDKAEKRPARPERSRDRGPKNGGKGGDRPARAERPEKKEKNAPAKQSAPKKEKESKPRSVVIPETELKLTPRTVEAGEDMSYEFIKTLIVNLGLDASIELYTCEDGTRRVNIVGEDASALIGHHGDTLDALQYLANLASAQKNIKGEKDKSRVTIDIEGYRAKREETLRALARRMAAKALRNNRSVMLEPMSAYERRIIHSEVQGIEGVSTNSIGSDNNRKIVIYLTDKKPKELFDKEEETAEAIAGISEEKGTEKNSLENVALDDGETAVEADAISLRGTTELCDACETCENADLCPTSNKEEDEAAPALDVQDNA
ncbi:MAG: Jag N-terminal domain-containing protein [Clostridia bacterium]|nr:Jag N-terminal domain-containing protein [Clostridia bacterium]